MAVLISEGRTVFKIGDVVTPKCPAGLWLADRAPTGAYIDPRVDACIFTGRGTVTAVSTCVIDYDEWDREAGLLGHDAYNIGQVEYTSYLIECDAGVGWAGEGAIIFADLG